jgi:hypothetical protein
VHSDATMPSSTLFVYPRNVQNEYKNFKTPKNMADYIKWLERFTQTNITQLEDHFKCFKNWAQWQLKAENVEIDDGDLDDDVIAETFKYQEEHGECKICEVCTKNNTRNYLKLPLDKTYPNA